MKRAFLLVLFCVVLLAGYTVTRTLLAKEKAKEYRQLMQDEQRETLSAMMFNGDLSPSDINAALNALGVLFSGQGDKTAAIQRLQDIAKEQDNSVISNPVSEIGNENG